MIYTKSSSIALVTGGGSGIGKAIATKFADEGLKVVSVDIKPQAEDHPDIIYKTCDVTNGPAIDKLYTFLNHTIGHPDILVLSAGKGIHEQLLEGDPEKWRAILDLNVMGVLRCIRSFVPAMKEKKQGEVVLISSVAATQAYPYGGIYSASKVAVEIIAETLRIETLPHVRVTTIAAGVTDTGFFANEISGNKTIESIGMGSLAAKDIAEDVWYAINKKIGTAINKIITRPTSQDF